MTSLEKPFGQHHAYFMLRKMYLLTRQVGQIMSQAFHKKQNSCPDYLKKPAAVLRPDFQAVGRRWEKVVGLHHTTLAVYLHRLNDPRGNCLEFIEKNCRRAWGHSKDFPEIFFYRNIAPKRSGWSRVPRCLHSESGLLSYRLFLERIAGRRVCPL